jgi:hypothetical protein
MNCKGLQMNHLWPNRYSIRKFTFRAEEKREKTHREIGVQVEIQTEHFLNGSSDRYEYPLTNVFGI